MAKMNPKYIRAQKEGKAPLEYIPLEVLAGVSRVLAHGAEKYGVRNWRKDEILMSTYKAAILRHLTDWSEGRRIDPDSGEDHLCHIMACCMVVLDAITRGKAIDDLTIEESKNNE
jgi:hypothetical protein